LLLIAGVIRVRQHLGEEYEGRALFGGCLLAIIEQAERGAAFPFGAPALEIGVGQLLEDQAADDDVFRVLVVLGGRDEGIGVIKSRKLVGDGLDEVLCNNQMGTVLQRRHTIEV
jgi:hypothetical protein